MQKVLSKKANQLLKVNHALATLNFFLILYSPLNIILSCVYPVIYHKVYVNSLFTFNVFYLYNLLFFKFKSVL